MIELSNGYQIEADERCYTLFKVRPGKNKKTGEVVDVKEAIGYYGRLSAAIMAYSDELERKKLKDGSMSLSDAVNAIVECRESVKRELRKAMPEVTEVAE